MNVLWLTVGSRRMDAETTAAEFRLGTWVWLAGVAASLLAGATGMLTDRGAPEYLLGVFMGGFVAALGLAALFAWIAWRLAGRSLLVARLVFAVFLMLSVFGQFARVAGNVVDHGTFQEVVRIQQEHNRQLQAAITPELTAADVPAKVASLDALFEPAVARGAARMRPLIQALREHQRDSATRELTYAAAVQAFVKVDVTSFREVGSDDERARRRLAIQGLVDAGHVYRAHLDARLDALRDRLAHVRGFDELIAGIMKGATQSNARKGAALARLLKARETYADQLLALYDLLDRRAGNWTANADGTIVFAQTEDLNRFDAIAAGVDEANAKLVEAEAAIVR
jgi:hypothetical protein